MEKAETVIEQLQRLGFSQYEAQAYLSLLKDNPLNGYELARASGIPRPNIYPVLQKLEERGAVLRLDTPDGSRYSPVAPDELLTRLRRRYQDTLDSAADALKDVSAAPALDYVLNLNGRAVMLDHARALLNQARSHLLLSIWPEEAHELAEPMEQAQAHGVQITTLCLRGCPQPCPACRGSVFRYAVAPANSGRWLVLVSDDEELLAAAIGAETTLAVRTRQKMLVHLSASYIQNSIALASLLSGLGSDPAARLDPQTLAALNALHPLEAQGKWLEVMKRMLKPQQPNEPAGTEQPQGDIGNDHHPFR